MERDIAALDRRVGVVEGKVTTVSEAVVEHRTRLENGSHVFSEQKSRLAIIEEKIEVKPPSVLKIISITLVIVLTGASSLWALANTLRDRPTLEQIDKIIDSHNRNGHKEVREEARTQRKLIENVQLEQKNQGKKLDTLLTRTPKPPPLKKRRKRRSP